MTSLYRVRKSAAALAGSYHQQGQPRKQHADTRSANTQQIARCSGLVVVLATVPLGANLIEEMRISLSLGIGLVHRVELGHQGVALGR